MVFATIPSTSLSNLRHTGQCESSAVSNERFVRLEYVQSQRNRFISCVFLISKSYFSTPLLRVCLIRFYPHVSYAPPLHRLLAPPANKEFVCPFGCYGNGLCTLPGINPAALAPELAAQVTTCVLMVMVARFCCSFIHHLPPPLLLSCLLYFSSPPNACHSPSLSLSPLSPLSLSLSLPHLSHLSSLSSLTHTHSLTFSLPPHKTGQLVRSAHLDVRRRFLGPDAVHDGQGAARNGQSRVRSQARVFKWRGNHSILNSAIFPIMYAHIHRKLNKIMVGN